MRVKPLDILVLALGAAVVVSTAALVYARGPGEPTLLATGQSGEWVYRLKPDRTVEIPGPLGDTTVEISGGRARIVDSPCPNKTCVAGGWISTKGQWLACLPNAVMLRVGGDAAAEGEVDAGVY